MKKYIDKLLNSDGDGIKGARIFESIILIIACMLGVLLGRSLVNYVSGDYKMLTLHDIEIVSEINPDLLLYDVVPEVNVKYTINDREYVSSVIVTDAEYKKLAKNEYKDEMLITPLWYDENDPDILYRTLKNAKNGKRIVQ